MPFTGGWIISPRNEIYVLSFEMTSSTDYVDLFQTPVSTGMHILLPYYPLFILWSYCAK